MQAYSLYFNPPPTQQMRYPVKAYAPIPRRGSAPRKTSSLRMEGPSGPRPLSPKIHTPVMKRPYSTSILAGMSMHASVEHHPGKRRLLRVSIVTETYPPEVNGVAMTIGRLTGHLRTRGHRVQLVRPRQGKTDRPACSERWEEALQPGIPLPMYRDLRIGLPAGSRLRTLWRRNRPQIVHIVTEGPLGRSALGAALDLDIPVTSGFHTNFHQYSRHYGLGLLQKAVLRYLRAFHNRTARTFVPTRELAEQLEAVGFKNTAVNARGVDTSLFTPLRRDPALRAAWGVGEKDTAALMVGRLAPEKNIEDGIAAFHAMKEQGIRGRLVFVGDGPARRRLERRGGDFVFCGMRLGEDLAAHFASADVFLFPSLTETFGNVVLEAMASGLAIVAYDYAAARNHLSAGESGLLAPANDRTAFLNQAALAGDGALRQRLGAAARSAALSLDWERVVDRFESVLFEVIQGR